LWLAGTIFLSGKRINENLKGWLDIAKKVRRLFQKQPPTRIDEQATFLLVLEELSEKGELLGDAVSAFVQILEFTPVPSAKGTLGKRPDALYIVSVKTSEGLHIYGIKSSMKVEFKHQFQTGQLDF